METINIKSPKYPKLLKEIYTPPENLYLYGNKNLLYKKCISIVGTRKLSSYGRKVINLLLTKTVKDMDVVIVSGLAVGTDAYVHSMCLKLGIDTIAVVPGCISTAIPYPNRDLLTQIKAKGLIIAEYNKTINLGKWLFIQRNRIIAGLSKDCIVIEAGVKSGSLTTANFAMDFNRNVYAIPGDIDSPTSLGCNELIKQGAEPIVSVEDFNQIICIQKEQISLF
ncbi:DNA-processing protein DprA [bacterium]|nr:DNA-processing protein DprA [bacterium]